MPVLPPVIKILLASADACTETQRPLLGSLEPSLRLGFDSARMVCLHNLPQGLPAKKLDYRTRKAGVCLTPQIYHNGGACVWTLPVVEAAVVQ